MGDHTPAHSEQFAWNSRLFFVKTISGKQTKKK